MDSPWVAAMLSVAVVSLASLAGISTFILGGAVIQRMVFWLVSFAAGSLLGGVFLHLLPEAVEESGMSLTVSVSICVGILLFFLLEKFLAWRHCHLPSSQEHPHRLSTMNLVGDGLHNLLDGLIIGAAYIADVKLGVATTAAVLLHEIPQEIADLGVLIYSGMTRRKAVMFNMLSASAAFVGAAVALAIGPSLGENLKSVLIPVTAGAFIYIAGSDLIPELHKETATAASAGQFVMFTAGLALMLGLRFLPFAH
ncbi:MAG TPA: ZIP family metal transporter [Planctomycetota bacterium]|nr:ZIP family metal transporter [Planctomycetota bacterium]